MPLKVFFTLVNVGESAAAVARTSMVGGHCGATEEKQQMVLNSQGLFRESSAFTAHIPT